MLAKRFFSSSFASALDLTTKSVISFGISIYIARKFGVEYFAIFTLAMSAQVVLSTLIRFGIGPLFLREMCIEKRATVMAAYFSALIFNSLIAFLILIVGFLLLDFDPKYTAVFIVMTRALWVIDVTFKNVYYSDKKIEKFHSISIFANLCFFFLLILGVYFKASFIIFSIILVTDTFIFYVLLKIFSQRLNFNYTYKLLEIYENCLPLFMTGLCVVLYMNLDRWMLLYLVDQVEVAQYGSAYRVNAIVFQLIPVTLGVLTPLIFSNKSDTSNSEEEKNILGPFVFLLSIFSTVLMYFLGPIIILVFFGDQFYQATQISQILSLMILLVFWGSFQSIYLIRDDNLGLYLKLNVIILVLNVVLNFILIPEYGAIGSIYATLLSGLGGNAYVFYVKNECFELFRAYTNLKRIVGYL